MGGVLKVAIAVITLSSSIPLREAQAIDLSGAWATNADQCSQVFTRRGRANQVGFTSRSEQHGGGFIVEADRLRGKFAKCKIKSTKEEGQTVNIIAGCATDIILSNVQFSLQVIEPNKILRTFPGMQDIEISYYRCPTIGNARSFKRGKG